ncbi:MAG: hypothetical protein DI538_06205 [Azospira oryzae]|nr:MAG: hypothetical protein DI538_06205 [Azospira oryzae]
MRNEITNLLTAENKKREIKRFPFSVTSKIQFSSNFLVDLNRLAKLTKPLEPDLKHITETTRK